MSVSRLVPAYDEMFRRLERARWVLEELPFDRVERERVSQEELEVLRANCLLELSSLYAERMFLRDFRELPDFCQFTSIWFYEETKHYLVLREYLKVFGLEPDVENFPALDLELAPSAWAPTLALHYCGELRLGMWYHRWSELAEEPVLARIYRLIGDDEFRHAGCYAEFMRTALERNPALLPEFLNASKWMLFNPDGDKHPTTMKSNASHDCSVLDRIGAEKVVRDWIQRTIRPQDEERVRRQVLSTLSTLSGRRLATMTDLVSLTRALSHAAPAAPVSG